MFKWLEEFYEIRRRNEEGKRRPCESCEILKLELDRANRDRDKLLSELLKKPEEPKAIIEEEKVPIKSRHIPWAVRQQALEEKDREQARINRQFEEEKKAAARVSKLNTEQLEEQLGIREVTDAPSEEKAG